MFVILETEDGKTLVMEINSFGTTHSASASSDSSKLKIRHQIGKIGVATESFKPRTTVVSEVGTPVAEMEHEMQVQGKDDMSRMAKEEEVELPITPMEGKKQVMDIKINFWEKILEDEDVILSLLEKRKTKDRAALRKPYLGLDRTRDIEEQCTNGSDEEEQGGPRNDVQPRTPQSSDNGLVQGEPSDPVGITQIPPDKRSINTHESSATTTSKKTTRKA
ncbi:hypothetical protein Cgig2_020613 [Carnegiea gigantea]|uniref:Uncharacterized protein n=1 Tax=Carnegiea gigantea TaxID=171969 RepID=A0A9Q1JXA9_9CARY|nr:hypothetical protein Cgig2_020613 [Carnegiea gigantea]